MPFSGKQMEHSWCRFSDRSQNSIQKRGAEKYEKDIFRFMLLIEVS